MNNFLVEYCFYFLVYGTMGWMAEVIYTGIRKMNFQNRGFLYSPILPIYGFGAVLIILFLRNIHNVFLIFLVGMAVTTALEYFTAVILENVFHVKWWDYSKYKFNYKGRIALKNSILFGLLCVALMVFVHPQIQEIYKEIGVKRANSYNTIYLIVILFDLYFTLKKLSKLPVRHIELLNSSKKYSEKITEKIDTDSLQEKYFNDDSKDYLVMNLIISIIFGFVIYIITMNIAFSVFLTIPTYMFLYTIRQKRNLIKRVK